MDGTMDSRISPAALLPVKPHLQKPHHYTDLHQEESWPLHHQLPAAHPVLRGSGLGLLHDLRQLWREAQLQGHCAARHHCDAAYSERYTAFFIKQDSTHR